MGIGPALLPLARHKTHARHTQRTHAPHSLTPSLTPPTTLSILPFCQIAKQVILELDPRGVGIPFLAFKTAVDRMPDFLFNFGMPN